LNKSLTADLNKSLTVDLNKSNISGGYIQGNFLDNKVRQFRVPTVARPGLQPDRRC